MNPLQHRLRCIAPLLATLASCTLTPLLAADALPRFVPQPLLIEVAAATTANHNNAKANVLQRYYVTGQNALEAPIRITPRTDLPSSASTESGLFDYIAYTLGRGQQMENAEELLERTVTEDPTGLAELAKWLADPQVRESILQANRSLEYIDYQLGWFQSPRVFLGIGTAHTKDGNSHTFTMRHILTDEGWRMFYSKIGSPLEAQIHFATLNGSGKRQALKDVLNVQPTDGTRVSASKIDARRNEIRID